MFEGGETTNRQKWNQAPHMNGSYNPFGHVAVMVNFSVSLLGGTGDQYKVSSPAVAVGGSQV